MAVTQLLAEIRAVGYPGSANLLRRYLNQGRAEDKQQHLSPRRAARLLLTRPANLTDRQRERLHQIADACPEIAAVRSLVAAFAALLTPEQDNPARLQAWMDAARSSDLPRAFVRPRAHPGPRGRQRRTEHAAPQQQNRGRQHPNENDQTTDIRPRRLRTTSTPNPSQLTTESAPEPLTR